MKPAYDATDCGVAMTKPKGRKWRWVWHEAPGWLFGFTRYPGWFGLHLGPGFLEWGDIVEAMMRRGLR